MRFPITFTIEASPKTKKNHSQFVWVGTGNGKKFPKLVPSKQYVEFEKASEPYCPKLYIDIPVNIKVTAYVERRSKVDLANMLNAVDDILVKHGTITDDNRNIVYSHDGSRILWDKEHPRVEIEITKTDRKDFQIWKTEKEKT